MNCEQHKFKNFFWVGQFSEYSTHEVTFQMDQTFHVPWDKESHIEHFCTRPKYNVIECKTHEPLKGNALCLIPD